MKIMFFLRLSSEFGMLVTMLGTTIKQTLHFLVFFVLWVTFFAFLYMNLNLQIQDADTEYLNLGTFVQYWLYTYRCSVGDISVPGYKHWVNDMDDSVNYQRITRQVVITLTWMLWFFNQF